jgi:threonine dehydratase
LPSLKEVLLAEKVIRKYLSPTPLVWSRRLSREIGADVRVKLENLNPTNSFGDAYPQHDYPFCCV